MGVVTTSDVPEGRCFGPLPQSLSSVYFIAQAVLKEQPPDIPMMKVDVSPNDEGEFWLPFVRPARHIQEQNLEMCIKHGRVYYRARRNISADEQLLVWYSADIRDNVGLPSFDAVKNKDGDKLFCPYCKEEFQHPNQLCAHALIQCTVYASLLKHRINNAPVSWNGAQHNQQKAIVHCKHSSAKRKFCDLNDNMKTYAHMSISNSVRDSIGVVNESCSTSPKTDVIEPPEKDARSSAFRKVEKLASPSSPAWHAYAAMYRPAISNNLSLSLPYRQSTDIFSLPYLAMPGHLSSLSDTKIACAAFNRDAIKDITDHAKQNSFSSTLQSGCFNITSADKIIGNTITRGTDTAQLMAPPSSLMAHATNLAQNWCAKCNASFRMTSDLVYHMRSHHKRDFSTDKKKRDEKLHCNVCGEKFRERHHLTRHMTSHD